MRMRPPNRTSTARIEQKETWRSLCDVRLGPSCPPESEPPLTEHPGVSVIFLSPRKARRSPYPPKEIPR